MLVDTVRFVLEGDVLPAEVIVIDQSDEKNVDLETFAAGEPRVRYLWKPDRGLGRARNAGIAASRHDFIVFVDDDVRPTPSWFGNIVRALAVADERDAVTGRVLPEAPADEGGFVPSTIEDLEPKTYEGLIWEDVLYGNNMAMRRALIDEIGPFDDRLGAGARFRSAEDNEFAFRLLEAGHRIHYVPEATVYHRAWRRNEDYLPLCWDYGYGQGAFYAKHLRRHSRFILERLRYDLIQRSRRVRQFARPQPQRAKGQFVYIAGLLAGAATWLATQFTGRPEKELGDLLHE